MARANEAFALEAGQAATILFGETGRERGHVRPRAFSGIEPSQALGPLLLELLGQFLHGESFQDIFRRGREEGQDGVGAVGLVLFETSP